ncbi:phBC6A51 family helix-turn-helix protein [Alicyclobacillus fastidiosus]|uniref:PhBC6A51 family helix-turn-helix protein n=1 Tax=Alicyclobacillus fastidiosus TaxID=392011 RepID=A0ABV5AJ02_9BACL|nr:phBC6A51 family helix-turn-helix protein [Alicyclobacillus fastidiosus]WEH11140.1 phBC6A51 family helix-turn-helix protein [Alicyclobacillus fastidiosus]
MSKADSIQRYVEQAIIEMPDMKDWQKAAIVLLSTKPDHKMTYEQIAEELGISTVTLYQFRQRSEVHQALLNFNLARVIDRIPAVTEAMVKKSVDRGDPLAAKLIFQIAGLLVERRAVEADVKTQVVSVADKTEDDLEAELARLRDRTND